MMKVKKKTAMVVSFTVGVLLFATTAIADIANKSGYDEFKDAIKMTAQKASDSFDSCTIDVSTTVKHDDKIIMSDNNTKMYDKNAGAVLSSYSSVYGDMSSSGMDFSDKSQVIHWSNEKPDTYYVQERIRKQQPEMFRNIFEDEEAADVEKIIDIAVGNLKNHVVSVENSDGSKQINGSLTEVQIPALANALVSYTMKSYFRDTSNKDIPHTWKDIYVKQVDGTAQINKDGVVKSVLGSVVLSGKDNQEKVHEIKCEALITLSDINSTIVTKPDLDGKKVVRSKHSSQEEINKDLMIGKFKNNILLLQDGKYIKIGERKLNITQIEDQLIKGHYTEEYKEGYESYAVNKTEFDFSAAIEGNSSTEFKVTLESNKEIDVCVHLEGQEGKIYFSIQNQYEYAPNNILEDFVFLPDLD